ncbi:MAG: tetratricopeptide repeat protein [Gammaproteobacteria bacterium]|nr:tetratricopeptide repeat protein [Gammaproteobacteria bacterium]
MPESSRRKSRQRSPAEIAQARRLHIIALSLLVLVVFASSLAGSFVWTDREDIVLGGYRVTDIDDLGRALSNTREAYRLRAAGVAVDPAIGSWQPLTALSNSLSWTLWGDCAFCFHLENVILHLLVVVGLYALGRHLLSQRRHGARIAAWAAAIFAIHPATLSSVAWIGGRSYLLAALFTTWSLVLFTRLQATTKSERRHVNRWLLTMSLAGLAAMTSHEIAYVLPFAALLVGVYESRERGRPFLAGIAPMRIRGLALLGGGLLLVILYRQLVMGGMHAAGEYPTSSLLDNVGTALRHFWYLLESVVLPGEPVLSDAWRISQGWGTAEVAALLGVVVLLVAVGLGLTLSHPSALGGAWFLLWILPGVGFLPTEYYHNPHILYLASWGLALAVSYALFVLWRPLGRQLLPGSEAVIYVPLILLLAVITAFSNARWWEEEGLFEAEIAHDPHYIEGRLRLAARALETGAADIALNHVLTAIDASHEEGYTGHWSPHDGYLLLGRSQFEMGLVEESVGSFRTALEHRPSDSETLYRLGLSLLEAGNLDAAEQHLRQVLAQQPDHAQAAAELGVLLARDERFAEAEPLLTAALQAGLGNPRRHRAMALVMIDAGELAKAGKQLEAALAGRENTDDRARLAWVSWQLGQTDKAYSDLNMAMQMEEGMTPYLDWVQQQIFGGGSVSADRETEPGEAENE